MRPAVLLPSFVLLLGLADCSAERSPSPERASPPPDVPGQPQGATASPIKPLDKKEFGAPITEVKTTALTDIVKEPAKFTGHTIRTEGVVSAVCKSMGCWMEIADESGAAHIKMAGHSFFVPREASGHRAVVQGRMLSAPDEGGTCAMKDGCREDHEKETGRIAKVEIEATGVQFVD
jgi:hypothetical protein